MEAGGFTAAAAAMTAGKPDADTGNPAAETGKPAVGAGAPRLTANGDDDDDDDDCGPEPAPAAATYNCRYFCKSTALQLSETDRRLPADTAPGDIASPVNQPIDTPLIVDDSK